MVEFYNILIFNEFPNNNTSPIPIEVLFCIIFRWYIHICTQKTLSQQYWKEFTIQNWDAHTQYYRDGMKISLLYSDDLFQLSSINHWTYRRAYVVLSINCLQSSPLQHSFIFFVTFFFCSDLFFKLMKFYDDGDIKCNHLWATFCCSASS